MAAKEVQAEPPYGGLAMQIANAMKEWSGVAIMNAPINLRSYLRQVRGDVITGRERPTFKWAHAETRQLIASLKGRPVMEVVEALDLFSTIFLLAHRTHGAMKKAQDPLARLADNRTNMKKPSEEMKPGEIQKVIQKDGYRRAGANARRRSRDT